MWEGGFWILKNVRSGQTWGQIHKYLHFKVHKYFFSRICICIWAFQNKKYYIIKYIPKVFDISNTIQIHLKYFCNLYFDHILSSPAILLMRPIFMAFYCLLIETSIPWYYIIGTQGWTSVWWIKMSLLVMV